MSKKHPSTNYTSCFKIDGVPILPPLLTPEKRKEMAYYKQLALAVEERIRLLKENKSETPSHSKQQIANTNFYHCGDYNYELVYAEPLSSNTTTDQNVCNKNKQLDYTSSCPNQSTYVKDNLEVKHFTSVPVLVRSNSYTLDEPSPLLQAQLEKQGIFENGKGNKWVTKNNHMGGCGDNIGQTKIGIKRKLPMKYADKKNYNGYSIVPKTAYESDLNTEYVSDQSSTEFIYSSQTKPMNRQSGSIYSVSSNSGSSNPSEETNDLETTIEANTIEAETLMRDESYQTSHCNESYNGSVTEQNLSQKTSRLSEIIIPLEAQKSIQNLIETIQNNHTAQMQKLIDQQKVDQELLKQAFEKHQAVLLNEIHKSYSLPKFCNASSENSDPEISRLQNRDNNVHGFEDKCSENGSDFIRSSEVILSESKDLLKCANSSIGSHAESRYPSAKLSQECLSSITSSVAHNLNSNDLQEFTPNSTLDDSEQYCTPIDTPIKSKLDDYKKSVQCFEDLKIEDINEETGDYGKKLDCDLQDGSSQTNISVETCNRTISYCTSLHRVKGEVFHEVKQEQFVDPEMERKDRASTVICAAARSFLVRRLLRTQKVCSIKRAIRETLLCALKLHGEGGIKTTDADLHRRLIQQLNSACHELHDIFFKTTVAERMRMISCDRDIMTGSYRHHRAGSTMSNNSADNRHRNYSLDCRQHSRHTSSRSLDKHSEANYGEIIECDI
ncbi:uncharacterized protein LOC113385507 [Ctenocephalides felis]|uniref:uncharacterized protein LOC113385507 n=1 Tax=Ctenocephalides felis TaxID=7515 RepID=UPI000E6E33DC|nr:uncharacterized protein LOC113385507 [Ctenocephalides felis]